MQEQSRRLQPNLSEYAGEDRVVSSHELSLELQAQPDAVVNLKSFIPSLDTAVDGFRDGELVVISGPTKNGKTLFAQSLTVAFNRQQYQSLWFSFEVPMRQFLGQFREFPSLYTPRKLIPHAFPWFEQKVKESFLKYHTRIVFIDHLHYLIDLAKLRNPSIDIGNIIRKMKTLAVQDGLVIFLLCHTTKIKDEEDLSANSIRDSSFVGQESDTVFMIKRTPKDGETTARLRVEFHRRTGVIERVIRLRKEKGYLVEEIDSSYGDDN